MSVIPCWGLFLSRPPVSLPTLSFSSEHFLCSRPTNFIHKRRSKPAMARCIVKSETKLSCSLSYCQPKPARTDIKTIGKLSVKRRKTDTVRLRHSISNNNHSHGFDEHHHSHSHSHSHSQSHSHGADACGCSHQRPPAGVLNKFLRKLFAVLRLDQVARLLDGSVWAMVAMVLCYFVALIGNVLSNTLLPSYSSTISQVVHAATLGVYVLGGIPEAVELAYNLADLHIDTHVLMTLAVFGTLWMGAALEGALLLVLFRLSHAVEHKLTEQAQGNMRALMDSVPEYAVVVDMDEDQRPMIATAQKKPAAEVAVGTTVLVRPGEQVPLDGEVVYGRALVSAKHITGESLPILKKQGQQIAAGCLNHDGVLVVRSSRTSAGSTPSRIANLTITAQAKKPQLRRWLDVFGEWYSKFVVVGALVALVVLVMSGVPLLSTATQRGALYRAMGLLTVASPCALVMVPLAYVSAIATVTSRGLLIKGARVLDALAAANTVAFDKTGTLTTGTLSCNAIIDPHRRTTAVNGISSWIDGREDTLDNTMAVSAAVALSLRSSHPVALAMQQLGHQLPHKLTQLEVKNFKLVPGAGVQATVSSTDGTKQHFVQFGSQEFVCEMLPEQQRQILQQAIDHEAGCSVVSVLVQHPVGFVPGADTAVSPPSQAAEGYVMRVFSFEDTIRQRSAAAVSVLRGGHVWKKLPGKGIRVVMLTGDNRESASYVGRLLGISEVHAALTPEEKLQQVEHLNTSPPTEFSVTQVFAQRTATGGVIMVGDGLNDAPALASACVGMAVVTTPEDATATAADVLVMNTDPISAIPFLLAVSYRTQAILRQNLAMAFGSIIVLALPTVLGFIPLWLAVMLHEGATLMVALNSLRLLATPDHQHLSSAYNTDYKQPASEERQIVNGSGHDPSTGAAGAQQLEYQGLGVPEPLYTAPT